jgi:hypothetical protein
VTRKNSSGLAVGTEAAGAAYAGVAGSAVARDVVPKKRSIENGSKRCMLSSLRGGYVLARVCSRSFVLSDVKRVERKVFVYCSWGKDDIKADDRNNCRVIL